MRRIAPTEAQLQAAIVEALRWRFPMLVVAHVPNEGKRSVYEGARQKRGGMLPGMPDLVVTLPNGRCAWIEVKTPSGNVTPEQSEIAKRLAALGHPWRVARSVEDAVAFVQAALEAGRAAA